MAERSRNRSQEAPYEQEAHARGDRWWNSLSDERRAQARQRISDLAREFSQARENGEPVTGARTQELAGLHVEWIERATSTTLTRDYIVRLGEMYVADPRFGHRHAPGETDPAPYAKYVRDALRVYAERNR